MQRHPKTEAISWNEGNEVTVYRELENTPEEQRCVHGAAGRAKEAVKRAQVGNLVTERGERGTESGRCLLCGEEN